MWHIKSREDAIDYANEKGIDIPVSREKIFSRDKNLMHISHEGGYLEDSSSEHKPEDLYLTTKALENTEDKSTYIKMYFEKGIPIELNNKPLGAVEILEKLNKIGSENSIGVEDILENRIVGMKSRGIYETPGATILMKAHKELECLTLDKMTFQYKQMISLKYAELVYNWQWYSTLRESLDSFVNSTQENVTGTVRLKLYKGNIIPAGMNSPYALFDYSIASFGDSEFYDQKDATGFINIYTLPYKIKGINDNRNKNHQDSKVIWSWNFGVVDFKT